MSGMSIRSCRCSRCSSCSDGKWLLLDVFHDDARVTAPPFSRADLPARPAVAVRSASRSRRREQDSADVTNRHLPLRRDPRHAHATKPAAELQVRACQCGFCTRHGAMTVSDPAGRATFEIERAALATYQFGTRTGTSLICARCGMYAGVMLEEGGKSWSVLNVRGLAIPEFGGRVPSRWSTTARRRSSASPAARPNGRRRRSSADDCRLG